MTYGRGWGKGGAFLPSLLPCLLFKKCCAVLGSHWEHRVTAQQSQGALRYPSDLGWCPSGAKKKVKILLIETLTLLRGVAGKSFDQFGVAPSWKIICSKLKYRKVTNTVALCLNHSSPGKAQQDQCWRGFCPAVGRLWMLKAEQEEMEKPLNSRLHSWSWHGWCPALLWPDGIAWGRGRSRLLWLCITSLAAADSPLWAQGHGWEMRHPTVSLADSTGYEQQRKRWKLS